MLKLCFDVNFELIAAIAAHTSSSFPRERSRCRDRLKDGKNDDVDQTESVKTLFRSD